jgi:hypothetical protein
MTILTNYIHDGMPAQTRAVLAYLQGLYDEDCQIQVAPWVNCREKGYILYSLKPTGEQLNIAFFQPRNGDGLRAIAWLKSGINPLNIDTSGLAEVDYERFKETLTLPYEGAYQMANIIAKTFEHFLVNKVAYIVDLISTSTQES